MANDTIEKPARSAWVADLMYFAGVGLIAGGLYGFDWRYAAISTGAIFVITVFGLARVS